MFIWKQDCAGKQQNVEVGVGSHSLRGAERDSEGTGVFSDKKQVSGSNPPLLLLTDFPESLSQSSTDMYGLVSLLKSPGVDTILRTLRVFRATYILSVVMEN